MQSPSEARWVRSGLISEDMYFQFSPTCPLSLNFLPQVKKLRDSNLVLSFKDGTKTYTEIRGHSTTTWTRRGGGRVSKKSTLVHRGGSLYVHVDKNFKETLEESWQMTMKNLIILHFLFNSEFWLEHSLYRRWLKTKACVFFRSP